MPGDNGSWTDFDNFLTAMISAINKNAMTDGLDIEIWNEPDLTGVYWQRAQSQYLEMWGRAYHRLRTAFPNSPIVGPTSSGQPSAGNTWLNNYFSFVKSNNSIPDILIWHLEGNPSNAVDDLQTDVPALEALLSKYGIPAKPLIVNEYGLKSEQTPSASAWYISRFERYGVRGLRGNWASGLALHDYFAGLLGKPNAGTSSYNATQAGYWGNGEFNVYKYYATNMTGQRVQTTGSADRLFDVYATRGSTANSVKMLCGSRLASGLWDILVTNLTSVGLPESGTVVIHAYQFNYDDGEFGNVPHPVDQGTWPHTYTNNQLVFPVGPTTTTGYAFEFV